ncbi:MAG: biliverdin-producing heme oxygenase [Geminicoccaceae bacterium]
MIVASSRHLSPRHALRERTADTHAALDSRVGLLDTLDRYAGYVRGMHAFRAPVEGALADTALPGWFAGWRPLALGPAILADLADLGLQAPDFAAGTLPCLDDASSLLGVLYVLEGSSLGARLLYRQARALGLSEQHGARHLALQTADSQSWRSFVTLLERHPELDLERAVGGAIATFALAHDAFAGQR